MTPSQPVVTTVLYQKPEDDSGKETCFWIPTGHDDDWNKSFLSKNNFSDTYENMYLGRNQVCTTHGMVHIQKAGIQSHSKHGVFHSLGTDSRKGYLFSNLI